MGGQLSPPVTVIKKPRENFPLKALYIEALDEYFTEVPFKEEQRSLLESLECVLQQNPNLICFLSLPQESEEQCLQLIPRHLGKDSALEKLLRKQIKDEFWRPEFLQACADDHIETVHIGGVYGRACVWDCARSIADNIYSKQLGDKHPNIRYVNPTETYRFKNAIIFEDGTEGYIDSEITLNQLACFPVEKHFVLDPGHEKDIVSLGEAKFRGQVGESYELFSSVSDRTLPYYYELHKYIQHALSACDLLNLSALFWSSEKTQTPQTPPVPMEDVVPGL